MRLLATLVAICFAGCAAAEGLTAERLGVLYNLDDADSIAIANYYAARRFIPSANVVGLHLGHASVMTPADFGPVRNHALNALPSRVQSLALVWTRPFAVGCMSVTTAFAAGYRGEFCEPGCNLTTPNPLFDSTGWLPADTVGWWPSMLIPTEDGALAHALIDRGIAADGSHPQDAIAYLVRTDDQARNVRSSTYREVAQAIGRRVHVVDMTASQDREAPTAIAYFTGTAHVNELGKIHFVPGAVADHLTSTGGVLVHGNQMPVLAWLVQGATASYGSVTEPCNHLEKFPNIQVLLAHYLQGETVLESYWKSVAMPGQGLFVGDPLSRPYAGHR